MMFGFKIRFLAVLIAVFSALSYAGHSSAGNAIPESLTVRYDTAIPASAKSFANVCAVRAGNSLKIAELKKGDGCDVIGEMDDSYYVDCGGIVGYVAKSKLFIESGAAPETRPASAVWEISIKNPGLPWLVDNKTPAPISGTIVSSLPITEVDIYLYNLRFMSEDCGARQTFRIADNVLSLDLGALGEKLALERLGPGDRYLVVTASSGSQDRVLYMSPLCVKGATGRPSSVTADCSFNTSVQNIKKMTDNSRFTGWPVSRGGKPLTVTFPEGRPIGSIQVEWYSVQRDISLVIRGRDGQVLDTRVDANESGFLSTYYEFPEGAGSVEISAPCSGNSIVEMFVFEKGRVPQVVQRWKPLPEKVDMMLVIAHRDDELLFFGGTLPLYNAEGKTIAVVYMTVPEARSAYSETLAALWSAGQRYYPVYLGFIDERNTFDLTVSNWGGYETMYGKVAETIRRYKPDVVITHDIGGEFGHFQHILTSQAAREAVVLAADASRFPESARTYGVWDTPKLYVHLYEPDTRVKVPFTVPRDDLMGLSPLQHAYIAFEKHASEAGKVVYDLDTFGKKFDNTCFGLYRSTVGPDIENTDFFENIR